MKGRLGKGAVGSTSLVRSWQAVWVITSWAWSVALSIRLWYSYLCHSTLHCYMLVAWNKRAS